MDIIIDCIDCLTRIEAALLFLWGISLADKAAVYLKKKAAQIEDERLNDFIDKLTAAAEQLFHDEDIDGSLRLDYVQNMLIDAGYELNDAIRAKIESYVFKINKGCETK